MAMDTDIPILLVDDYQAVLTMVRRMLQYLGFTNTIYAVGGRDALAKLKAGQFRLVISDLNMADLDGMELLRQVRSDEALKDLPFIMLTATGEREQVMAARAAGVTDYIIKPFTMGTLRTKLTNLFGK
jgi:two-component system, chemotaxis family, chemotaxis protein CheY